MTAGKILFVLAMTLFLILIDSHQALAENRNIPQQSFHGGYNATSFTCDNCHNINEQSSAGTLTSGKTAMATCATCHGIYENTPQSHDPSLKQITVGTASVYTTYKISADNAQSQNGHRLGAANTNGQAGSENTPAANIGEQLSRSIGTGPLSVQIQLPSWRYWSPEGRIEAAARPAAGSGEGDGLSCTSCHLTHGLSSNSPVKIINNNLTALSSDAAASTAAPIADGIGLCLSCHPNYSSANYEATGGRPHNHPDRFCLQCHSNDASGGSARDFPHSGPPSLLSDVPDSLCVRCHVWGKIP